MRAVFALATLGFMGVLIADIVAHPAAMTAGLGGLNTILTTTFTGMLGNVPKAA